MINRDAGAHLPEKILVSMCNVMMAKRMLENDMGEQDHMPFTGMDTGKQMFCIYMKRGMFDGRDHYDGVYEQFTGLCAVAGIAPVFEVRDHVIPHVLPTILFMPAERKVLEKIVESGIFTKDNAIRYYRDLEKSIGRKSPP